MQILIERSDMEYKPISNRLKLVASFVPFGARLLDVGSDHAYLPIYLVQKGQINAAIAGEIVEGPYRSALSHVRENQLSHIIDVRLANGLEAFSINDKIDVITIAGMGGRLIADILESGKVKLAAVNRLILQPNNREDDVRRWLMENHFRLVNESILLENDKYYEVLVAEKGSQSLSDLEVRFGAHLLKEKTVDFYGKWQRELDKLTYALSCVPENKEFERETLSQKIDQIKGVLDASS